ncbi:MAG: hypothetical protein IT259_10900 [Saprospiraceae bacterium]|nr:hypothetical protein [Saprospiraceae bacterium]
MKNIIPLFLALFYLLAGCQSSEQKTPESVSPDKASLPAGFYFQFSQAGLKNGSLQDGDFCNGEFSKEVLVYPDASDLNKRWFILEDGYYKVMINGSKGVSSIMLKRGPGKAVEVISSAQFPICLSSKRHISLKENASEWGYDNEGGGIKYKVNVVDEKGWPRIEYVLPPEGQYGIVAARCVNCQ